jgi:hypothetical protein
MPRSLSTLLAFTAGAAFAIVVSGPAIVPERADVDAVSPVATEPVSAGAIGVALVEPAPAAGVPPRVVTVPRSHPSAGRAPALDGLDNGPPPIEHASPIDEETRAAAGNGLRPTLEAAGENP